MILILGFFTANISSSSASLMSIGGQRLISACSCITMLSQLMKNRGSKAKVLTTTIPPHGPTIPQNKCIVVSTRPTYRTDNTHLSEAGIFDNHKGYRFDNIIQKWVVEPITPHIFVIIEAHISLSIPQVSSKTFWNMRQHLLVVTTIQYCRKIISRQSVKKRYYRTDKHKLSSRKKT